jgi:protease IV
MPLTPDQWMERNRLRSQLRNWRNIALASLFGLVAYVIYSVSTGNHGPALNEPFIARFTVSGVIADDEKRDALLQDLADSPEVKAVIVRMDSPGGTTLGGEELYRQLQALSKVKPVVTVMRSVCASACYMAALGTHQLIARDTTLTGSIGVMLQSAELSGLMQKIGVKPITFTSGEFKDSPSMFRPSTPRENAVVQSVVNDTYAFFTELVTKHRRFTPNQLTNLANGQVFTGRQALKNGLIDGLGGEKEALKWLQTERKISKHLEIFDVKIETEYDNTLDALLSFTGFESVRSALKPLDGLVSIWHVPTINQ